jgi:hypothetical protein
VSAVFTGGAVDTVRRRQPPKIPRLEPSWSTRANSEPTNQSRRTAGRNHWNAIGRSTRVDDRAPVRSPGTINMGHFAAVNQWLVRHQSEHIALRVAPQTKDRLHFFSSSPFYSSLLTNKFDEILRRTFTKKTCLATHEKLSANRNFVVELVHFEIKRRKNYRIPNSKTLTFL